MNNTLTRSTKRIPNLVIEPIDECFPTIVVQVLSSTEIKPGIELMDDCERGVAGRQVEKVRTNRNTLKLVQ